jgi:y4mF family transcriptional regulator
MSDLADSDRRVAALAAAVRHRRRELGLRQEEVAALAGCSERFVHTLEHGKATVRLSKVLDVFEVLGLDLVVAPGRGEVAGPAAGTPGHSPRP